MAIEISLIYLLTVLTESEVCSGACFFVLFIGTLYLFNLYRILTEYPAVDRV